MLRSISTRVSRDTRDDHDETESTVGRNRDRATRDFGEQKRPSRQETWPGRPMRSRPRTTNARPGRRRADGNNSTRRPKRHVTNGRTRRDTPERNAARWQRPRAKATNRSERSPMAPPTRERSDKNEASTAAAARAAATPTGRERVVLTAENGWSAPPIRSARSTRSHGTDTKGSTSRLEKRAAHRTETRPTHARF